MLDDIGKTQGVGGNGKEEMEKIKANMKVHSVCLMERKFIFIFLCVFFKCLGRSPKYTASQKRNSPHVFKGSILVEIFNHYFSLETPVLCSLQMPGSREEN